MSYLFPYIKKTNSYCSPRQEGQATAAKPPLVPSSLLLASLRQKPLQAPAPEESRGLCLLQKRKAAPWQLSLGSMPKVRGTGDSRSLFNLNPSARQTAVQASPEVASNLAELLHAVRKNSQFNELTRKHSVSSLTPAQAKSPQTSVKDLGSLLSPMLAKSPLPVSVPSFAPASRLQGNDVEGGKYSQIKEKIYQDKIPQSAEQPLLPPAPLHPLAPVKEELEQQPQDKSPCTVSDSSSQEGEGADSKSSGESSRKIGIESSNPQRDLTSRISKQKLRKFRKRKTPAGHLIWTAEEDEQLRSLVASYGDDCWHKICREIPNKTEIRCFKRWAQLKGSEGKSASVPQAELKAEDVEMEAMNIRISNHWTKEEDVILKEKTQAFGTSNWVQISKFLPGRLGRQCRERWYNVLNPDIVRREWSRAEDEFLLEMYSKHGSKWSAISKMGILEGRTVSQIKNRYYQNLKGKDLDSIRYKAEVSKREEKAFAKDVVSQAPTADSLKSSPPAAARRLRLPRHSQSESKRAKGLL